MNKNLYKSIRKSQMDIQLLWMGLVYSSTAYVFTTPGGLYQAFTKVSLPSDWETMSPYEYERICEKYGACIIPFYEYVFSTMRIRFPLIFFKLDVLKHPAMTLS